jgi:anti-sigma B factor antagonist
MSLTVSTRHVRDVAIVDLSGRIVLGDETGDLRGTVLKILDGGDKKILLNLEAVSFIDSTGVGQLVSSFVAARNRLASLKLLKPRQIVKGVLGITQIDTVIPAFAEEMEAISSFAP